MRKRSRRKMRDKEQGRREEREGRKMSGRKIRGWRRGGGEKERVVIATNIDTKSFRLATLVPYTTMPLQTFDCFSCMPPIHRKLGK